MKCTNCGFDNEQDAKNCTGCGADIEQAEVSVNPVADKILCALKDKLFLAICILVTASASISLIDSNIPLLTILLSIFLWMVYSQGSKGIVNADHIRNVSGTVYAEYIIINVVCGILFVVGIVVGVLLTVAGDNEMLAEGITVTLGDYVGSFGNLPQMLTAFLGVFIAAIFMIAAVVGIVINIFGTRSIHRFVKTTYQSVISGELEIEKTNAARTWLMVLGILSAISAAVSLLDGEELSAIAAGASAAAEILASNLIKKYMMSDNKQIYNCPAAK